MAVGTIGKYERLDVLGHGTSGVVYHAWDTLLRREVALKEIRAEGPEMDRVLEEARVLDRLRHPNIVHVHSVDVQRGVILIDMELVRGRTLAAVLKERAGNPMPPAEAVRIALDILDALGYAHERRIIHRDIKPANILIADDGTVKLTDFGLAEALGTGSVAGGGGTYPYMAPEDFAEEEASDYRSDLWAVGVVLYEMLTGRRPFQVERIRDPFAWKRAIENEEPPRPSQVRPELPRGLDDLLVRALTKDKARRFPTAALFASTLRAVSLAPASVSNSGSAVNGNGVSPSGTPIIGPGTRERVEGGLNEAEEDAPFVFPTGTVCYSLDEFLPAAARHWDEARRALVDGRIQRFLRAIGEVYIADMAAELQARSASGENPDRLLREFLDRSQPEPGQEADEPGTVAGTLPAGLRPWMNGSSGDSRRRRRPRRLSVVPQQDAREEAGTVAVAAPRPQPMPPPRIVNDPPPPAARVNASEEKSKAREDAPESNERMRWWFWPLLGLSVAPPALALLAQMSGRFSGPGWYNGILWSWAIAGFLSAMLLVLGIVVRLPSMARFVAFLPVGAGLIAAGALSASELQPGAGPDGIVHVAIGLLTPLFFLLTQAATGRKWWRLWLALHLIGSFLAIAVFAQVALR